MLRTTYRSPSRLEVFPSHKYLTTEAWLQIEIPSRRWSPIQKREKLNEIEQPAEGLFPALSAIGAMMCICQGSPRQLYHNKQAPTLLMLPRRFQQPALFWQLHWRDQGRVLAIQQCRINLPCHEVLQGADQPIQLPNRYKKTVGKY